MILEAQPEDIDEVYSLWRILLDHHQGHHQVFRYKAGSEQALKSELLTRIKEKNTRVFVYQHNDEWVGMLMASLRASSAGFKLAHKGYIAETVLKEAFRGSGIGKELFEAARKWLIDQGADHIELQVSVHNHAGIRFWESLGFSPSTHHLVLTLK
ncbi:GNAT family N-acetyltransferase [Pontibacter sp. JH31]|uniref:GNAT family N-acetyltransferase n=1 Tax=Pontibacter aquaedesilientis TaxID=2766980 RepID=A0ABR7XKS2_9BACT|nr:GNAT family N-acetyltransferase [Pontibacter aquaedesilientis]MBD1398858.1 GNAT family N-acetyltransferase [Pontibacter aquaedesilientis]